MFFGLALIHQTVKLTKYLASLQCGFFKRNKKDHYDATYHKAEIHAQPSDKERLTSDAQY